MITREAFQQLPVVITSMSRWDGDVSSASLSLAKVLARTNTVYYIDFPYSLADVWRERAQPGVQRRMPALLWGKNPLMQVPGEAAGFIAATPGAMLPTYSLPEGPLHRWCTHLNNRRLAGFIRRIMEQNGHPHYLLLNSFNPFYLAQVNRYLQPLLSVYHSRDAIEEVGGQGLQGENQCVQHYDLAMATARQLCRNISARNHQPVAYFPNGGDVQLFRRAVDEDLPVPQDIAHITTPIIGYTGAV